MTDQTHGPPQPQPPQPPAGMQRPGIPGAGNLLDPEVRGDLREQLRTAAQGAGQQLHGAQQQQGGQQAPAEAAPESLPPQQPVAEGTHRAGPFPHGDVDLRGLVPNVLPGVRPQRGRAGRQFYFLCQPTTTDGAEPPGPAPPAGPKPG